MFDHELSYPVSSYTKQSRFVIYDNGAFAMQYESPTGQFTGRYTTNNGVLRFEFKTGTWAGTGTVAGDSLAVEFDTIAQLDGFDNAVYSLK